MLLDLVKIHAFYQAVHALLFLHIILLSPHNCKHYCRTVDIHCKWNAISWPLLMHFLSVLLLIVHLNSVLLLLDFLDKKGKQIFCQFCLWYYRDLWKCSATYFITHFTLFLRLKPQQPYKIIHKGLYMIKKRDYTKKDYTQTAACVFFRRLFFRIKNRNCRSFIYRSFIYI